jgi:GNAT superfamily N-acetyltransferase
VPRIRVRRAALRDLDTLVRHRRRMWEDMGVGTPADLDAADGAYRRWARARLRNGTLVGWLAVAGRRVVASGCLWLMVVHPRPGFAGGHQPYLLSFYTEPGFRGKGSARRIVQACVRWSRVRGYPRVTLHASRMGKRVYERLGFARTWEMKLEVRPGSPGLRRAGAAPPRRARRGPTKPSR